MKYESMDKYIEDNAFSITLLFLLTCILVAAVVSVYMLTGGAL